MREKKVYPLADGLDTSLRYAVVGNAERFLKHKHAWKAWKTLKGFGCVVYPVAADLQRLDGSKVYSDLSGLKGKIDVVVPCLKAQYIPDIVKETLAVGATAIWFQEKNWTLKFQEECDALGIKVVRGCILKHKIYPKPFGYFNPCYWHGLRSPKVTSRLV